MAIGGAFLGGGVEVVPAGSCKLELEILTEDRANLTATFTIKGTSTYTVTAGTDGRAVYTVPSGQTYTVSVNTTGYDNIASQTVVAESGTVRYVRFEAFAGRVKRSGDTITGDLGVQGIVRMVNGNLGSMARVGGNANGGKWYKVASLKPIGSQYTDVHMVLAHYDTYAYGNNPTQRVGILNVHVRRAVNTVTGELRFMVAGPNIDPSRYALITYADYSAELYVQQQNSYSYPNFVRLDANTSNSLAWTLYRENTSVDSLDTLGGTITYASKPVILPPEYASENSNAPATTAWVNGASSVVHTTGNETVAGIKVFSESPYINRYQASLNIQDNVKEIGVAPPQEIWNAINIMDKAKNVIGRIYHYSLTNGGTGIKITAANKVNDVNVTSTIQTLITSSGTPYATAPSTPSTAVLNEIATADWSLSKFVKKSGDTMTGLLKMDKDAIWLKSPNAINLKSNWTWMQGLEIRDSNETRMGDFRTVRFNDGTDYGTGLEMIALNSNSVEGGLAIIKLDNGTGYANAPSWKVGTNDNSNKILTIKMANGLPSLVHTTGDETVAGVKTHTANPVIYKDTNAGISTKAPNFNVNDTFTVWTRPVQYISYDKNNNLIMLLQAYAEANNRRGLDLMLYGSNGKSAAINMKIDGTKIYATAPSTPSDSTSNEIATADWVNTKVAQRNKVTNVTSYTQLMDLIKNGKRGDSFGITMDYVGGSLGGITAYDREVHAFGHYTIDEITVSGGALTGLQAFGSGEVSGELKDNDNTFYTYATTGFGRQAIGNGVIDAFRVVEDGKLTYFAPNDDSASISAFEGYYISI